MSAVDADATWRRWLTPRRVGEQAPVAKVATYMVLLLWTAVVLLPIYWVFITSFKLPIDVDGGPRYVPFLDFQPSLHAWRYIFVDLARDTLRPYMNSVVVALVATTISVTIGALAAYALVRIRFHVKLAAVAAFLLTLVGVVVATTYFGVYWPVAAAAGAALFILFLSTLSRRFHRAASNSDIEFWIISNRILPPVVAVLPIYIMFQQLRLLDTQAALIATYTAVNLPIVVWLMRDFFAGIPVEIEESAQVDGCSRFRIYASIVLPLARSGLAATFMLVLILCWNEYLLALFLSSAKAQTMPILVAAQHGTRGPQWWYMSALIVIMIAPVIAIAIALQRHIARGILLGAVKG